MRKNRKDEPDGIKRFLSSANIRKRAKDRSRANSVAQISTNTKSHSKTRQVLRPANASSRYMSVAQNDLRNKKADDTHSFQPVSPNLDSIEDEIAMSTLNQLIKADNNASEEGRVEFNIHGQESNIEDTVIIERNTEYSKQMSSCKKRRNSLDSSDKKPKKMMIINIHSSTKSRRESPDNDNQFEVYIPEHSFKMIKRGNLFSYCSPNYNFYQKLEFQSYSNF
jgi:hypothetical protein